MKKVGLFDSQYDEGFLKSLFWAGIGVIGSTLAAMLVWGLILFIRLIFSLNLFS